MGTLLLMAWVNKEVGKGGDRERPIDTCFIHANTLFCTCTMHTFTVTLHYSTICYMFYVCTKVKFRVSWILFTYIVINTFLILILIYAAWRLNPQYPCTAIFTIPPLDKSKPPQSSFDTSFFIYHRNVHFVEKLVSRINFTPFLFPHTNHFKYLHVFGFLRDVS